MYTSSCLEIIIIYQVENLQLKSFEDPGTLAMALLMDDDTLTRS